MTSVLTQVKRNYFKQSNCIQFVKGTSYLLALFFVVATQHIILKLKDLKPPFSLSWFWWLWTPLGGSLLGLHTFVRWLVRLVSPEGFFTHMSGAQAGMSGRLGDFPHDFSTWLARAFSQLGTVMTRQNSCSVGKGQWPLSSACSHVNVHSVLLHFLIFEERLKFQILL